MQILKIWVESFPSSYGCGNTQRNQQKQTNTIHHLYTVIALTKISGLSCTQIFFSTSIHPYNQHISALHWWNITVTCTTSTSHDSHSMTVHSMRIGTGTHTKSMPLCVKAMVLNDLSQPLSQVDGRDLLQPCVLPPSSARLHHLHPFKNPNTLPLSALLHLSQSCRPSRISLSLPLFATSPVCAQSASNQPCCPSPHPIYLCC